MSDIKTIASGAELTQETFDNFIARLKHDCIGEGSKEHITADAIFTVQAKRYIYGLDPDYCDRLVILCDESRWENPNEFYDDRDSDTQIGLDHAAIELAGFKFKDIELREQFELIKDLDEVTVTGMDETWVHINSHYTKDAAEAFIKRKNHDYRDGLRVYVNAQIYCWEWNAIKKALIDGKLTLTPEQILDNERLERIKSS